MAMVATLLATSGLAPHPASSSSSTATAASALSRRAVLSALPLFALNGAPLAASAGSESGLTGNADYLEELPPKAKQAYLQYLPQLQLDADYITFELMPLLAQPGRYDRITALTTSSDIGSAASVSRLDREFITPMRILALSFPPDLGGDDMLSAIDSFQKAMFTLSSQARKSATTGNVAAPSATEVKAIEASWDKGRLAFNTFTNAVNEGAGAKRLVPIPAIGQKASYPRSEQLYTQLLKDAALCRNRGGEQLAGIWGQLMVYGTVPGVNPCGNAAEKYFVQGM